MVDCVHRELTDGDIRKIADAYHTWRGDKDCKATFEDVPGFCKSATLEEIGGDGYILTPGRYVGVAVGTSVFPKELFMSLGRRPETMKKKHRSTD